MMMDDGEIERKEVLSVAFNVSHEAKLRELLHKINSIEIKLCKDGTKEFIKLLKSDAGGEFLRMYVHMSSNLSELLGAWKLHQGKPGVSYVLTLVSVILGHPEGQYVPNDKERIVISRALDRFAQSVIGEKLELVYKDVNSKEVKCQKASLLLMASIVRRGSGLASEVAKNFNFKLQGFSKLAGYKKNKNDKDKQSTRKAFVGFAMSFLEVAKPRLLRWILQQREMYSGVLRGLGNDDEETVTYVIRTLRDRVLTESSLLPPSLRSVLFGSHALEQLADISGREDGGPVAELAHNLLIMVCTDSSNGLMPDLIRYPNPLRGNPKRLLGLMMKLKATEISYHRDVLLAIVMGRPFFASAYMEEFPYNLEDYKSPTWFAIVSLAASLVSSVGMDGLCFRFLDSQYDMPSFDSVEVQSIMSCISPRRFRRAVINKGLLNEDFLVKNGTLRLFLEQLKLLDAFFRAINLACCRKERIEKLECLKLEIQNIIQTTIPDPQVLLTQLPSLSGKALSDRSNLKRTADEESVSENTSKRRKRLQEDAVSGDTDIIVGGISSSSDNLLLGVDRNDVDTEMPDKLDSWKEYIHLLTEIWGSDMSSISSTSLEDCETFFHCKLIDALKIYKLTLPTTLEGSFDFFMNLLTGPATLKTDMQVSLLSLLVEYIKWSPTSEIAARTPPLMYKHLQSFISLIFSPVSAINVRAYNLARAAMSSANIFDRNINEVSAWLLFLPGSIPHKSITANHEREKHQCLSSAVISFFCDAVSTVGNSLYRYWGVLRDYTCKIEEFRDVVPNFSPLVICILQKCLRLLISESNTFSLPQKSIVSLYVCNTLKYLLQTQDHMGLLSALIRLVLSEELQSHCTNIGETAKVKCEWRPLKNLLLFAESILLQKIFCTGSESQNSIQNNGSFMRTLGEASKIIESGYSSETAGLAEAFCSSILCATTDELVKNFPMVINISLHLQVPLSFLSSIVFAEQNFLSGIWKLWPGMFLSGLEKAVSEFDTQGVGAEPFSEDIIPCMNFDISESAVATAVSLFLMQAPFHVLLTAMMSIDTPLLKDSSKMKSLLVAKLSACKNDCAISYLQLVLFWLYQIQSSNRIDPLAEFEQLAEICSVLIKHILAQLLLFESETDNPLESGVALSMANIEDIVGVILSHPLVQSSLNCQLKEDTAIADGDFGRSLDLEAFHNFSERRVCRIDFCVFSILTTAIDYLLSPSGGQACGIDIHHSKQLFKALTTLVQRLFTDFRENFDLEVQNGNSLPLLSSYYSLHTLIRIISPFQILELVHWIFNRLNINDSTGRVSQKSYGVSGLTVGLSVACDAFEVLSSYLQEPTIKSAIWAIEEKKFDANVIEVIYSKLWECASNCDLDLAYVCLTKALIVSFRQKCMHHSMLDPLSLVLSRAIANTPLKILLKCISKPSITKGKLLFLLVEMSPLHLSVLGHIISGLVDKGINFKSKTVEETYISDDEYMVLLPAVLSYLNSSSIPLEKHHYCQFKSIPAFYSRILLQGFSKWKSFVSGDIFQENYEFLPSSFEELVDLVDNSLLGKAVRVLQHHNVLSGEMKTKDRLKLFNSLVTSSAADDILLDCDLETVASQSITQSLNHINKVVAKISVCRFILFQKDKQTCEDFGEADGTLKEAYKEKVSGKEGKSRMLFIKFLVNNWKCLVKKVPLDSKGSGQLYRYLELFILRTVAELLMEMHDGLVHLQSTSFVECLMKSSLLYRFEDPRTLKFLCHVLIILSDGKLPYGLFLQLLLGHSQFGATFHSAAKIPSPETGPIFRPISGILRSMGMPNKSKKNEVQSTDPVKQLGILRLVRVLLHLISQRSSFDAKEDIDVNLKELHSLLLTSYGATLHEIDLEKYAIMREIESIDESLSRDVAEVDYLWGNAALKIRKEDAEGTSNVVIDQEDAEEHRKIRFKENLHIDPNMCVRSVLHFPFDRTAIDEPSSISKLKSDNTEDVFKIEALSSENLLQYDPVYILHFSIHALSTNLIEPVDFAALGLLAIAFISLSSPDVGVRKLGYESLGRCKSALESYKKKKEVMRLRLLLTYIQNGIEEPWQRVPAVVALFAAESSFILLDPSNDHYTTLSKHLSHSSRVNLKSIPLFHTFFNSSYSRTERLWILRLAYAGLNLDDDAYIYMRNSVIETFLGYYASPLSDNDLKELILQVVKKAVKLHKLARYLVEQCGILPWLSSLLCTCSKMQADNERNFCSRQIVTIIEVVTEVIESRNTVEWLQNHALEQLMELTTRLYKLYVGGFKWIKEEPTLSNMVLQIIMLTKKMSQKRKVYQPHFTLSFEGLLNIYKASESYSISGSVPHMELALQTVLMSTPTPNIFHKDLGVLSNFLLWAVSTAMKSDSWNKCRENQGQGSLTANSEGKQNEESLTSKLLRWLVSSVILGKLFYTNNESTSSKRAGLKSLQSLLEYIERGCSKNRKCRFDCEEMLAVTIFYLQQVLGMNLKLLPSVVSALSVFLLGDSSKYSELTDKYGAPLPSLLSKIRCPPEANPAWRWSFFQPWKDHTSEMSDLEELDEYHACQSLLVVISNIIGNESRNSRFLSYQDIVNTGLFEREYNMLDTSS